MVKIGSIWRTADKKFQVIDLVNDNSGSWVHYKQINDKKLSGSTYSCYVDSFVERFSYTVEKALEV